MRINPSARESISEVHRCEPYVYAQMIAGKDAPTHGEAKNSWLTGTAAWNLRGRDPVDPRHPARLDGLRIDPHLPADWGEIEVRRRFRGTLYRIVMRLSRRPVAGSPPVYRLV